MISQRKLFYSYLAQTSDAPMELEIASAKGSYLYDINNKKYIDLISGISVSNVGHSHPKIVNAVKEQAEKYMHLMVYGEYIQSPQVLLAKKLTDILNNHLNNVYFVNSGSEAIEGALKLAKRHTKRTEIVSFSNAYHGSSHGALSIMGNEEFKNSFRPLLPGVKTLEYNSIDQLIEIDKNTAAVVIEVIQAEAGIIPPKNDFLKQVEKRCREFGALLIVDEIQTGFGRTGSFFGFQQFDLKPDIITCAKGMGGGMPIGAFISSKEIMQDLTHHPVLGHITTFGGHPVSAAASLACINVIEEEKLIDNISQKEALFKKHLVHPLIKEVRGKGLFLCAEFEDQATNFAIIKETVKNGVITDWFLFNDKCLRIAPPLNISYEEIITACEVIIQACDEIHSSMLS